MTLAVVALGRWMETCDGDGGAWAKPGTVEGVETRNRTLDKVLARFDDAYAGFAAGVRSGVGVDPKRALAENSDVEVLDFYAVQVGDVLTCWVLTPGMLTRYEQTPGGERLCVNLPLLRLRRISEGGTATQLTVTLEFDSDASAIALDAVRLTAGAEGAGSVRQTSTVANATGLIGRVEPLRLVLNPGRYGTVEQLTRFTRSLRRCF